MITQELGNHTKCGFRQASQMFLLSGIGGNLISLILKPESLTAGSSGSVYGILAVVTIDLLQSWDLYVVFLFW